MSDKGGSFERDQCRFLSLWFTNGERDDVFWRNRTRRTHVSPDGKHQLGDVMAVHSLGIPLVEVLNIELKTGYSVKKKKGVVPWDLLDIIDANPKLTKKDSVPTIIKFWKQAVTDADISKRIPMLIFHRDYHKSVVCIRNSFFTKLKNFLGDFEGNYLTLRYDREWLLFFKKTEFFDWCTPEVMLFAAKGRKEHR